MFKLVFWVYCSNVSKSRIYLINCVFTYLFSNLSYCPFPATRKLTNTEITIFQGHITLAFWSSDFLERYCNLYYCLGKTKSGFDFERISSGVTRATTVYLYPIFAGYDFTAKIGNSAVRVQMQCINKGPRERIQFQATAVYGSVSNSNQSKKIRSTAFIAFDYIPPNSSTMKGKTDRITVIAKRSVTGETFTQEIPILLLM